MAPLKSCSAKATRPNVCCRKQPRVFASRSLKKPSTAKKSSTSPGVKTAVGSWIYPEEALIRIAGVPLFSGFMYACVGSYMARIQRIFDITFTRYPPIWMTAVVAAAIYVNFFTHHYGFDFRWLLFAAIALLYGRSWMHYRVFRFRHRMPMLLAFLLVALFIWIAENIGTWSRAWIYPEQANGWALVSWSKLGSWYLLMMISVVLVTLVHPPRRHEPSGAP